MSLTRLHGLRARTLRVALALVLATLLLTGCGVEGVTLASPVGIHFKADYFQQYFAPSLNQGTPKLCTAVPEPTDQHWFVYMWVDGIDNSAPGASDFTFDPANLKPQNSSVTFEYPLLGYLDSYWAQQKVAVPAGQKLDASQIHQGAFFLIDYDQSTPASSLLDNPPVVYSASSGPGVVLVPDPHQTFARPGSAQPTNFSQVDVHTVPLVAAGPCQ